MIDRRRVDAPIDDQWLMTDDHIDEQISRLEI
jgi:hypothetical protein